MSANPVLFKDAEEVRDSVTALQKRQISALYEKWAEEIAKKAQQYAGKQTASAALMQQQLDDLKKALKKAGEKTTSEVIDNIQTNMYTTANAVVESNAEWLGSLGFSSKGIDMAFGNVPTDVVQNIVTGNVYKGGWNLSSAIWGSNEQTLKDAYEVVAAGVAQNMPVYDIAKLLEQYVSPSAKKPWNLVAADGKPIYKKKVDYNAQRLARTLVQHTYQQSFQAVTKENPFVHDYIWRANGSRVCELCKERDGKHFEKDKMPLDHPNGMCTMVPNMDSLDDISNQLAKWAESPEGKYPGIDNFAKKLGYGGGAAGAQGGAISSGAEFAAKYGTSGGTKFGYWYSKLDPDAKAIAKQLKDESGQTWQQWYEANIYKPKAGAKTKQPKVTDAVLPTDASNISVSDWIARAKGQTEERMLATEAENFAKMTSAQSKGIVKYTGSAYTKMNGYLRYRAGGMPHEDALAAARLTDTTYKQMLNAIDGLKTVASKEEFILRRGTDLGDLAGLMQGDFETNLVKLYQLPPESMAEKLNEMFAGHVGTYAGFTSTSSIWDRGFGGKVEVVMRAPVGTQGSSVMSISQFGTGEGEFLLNAGTRVRVVKIEESDGHKGSKIRVWMDIIGTEEVKRS